MDVCFYRGNENYDGSFSKNFFTIDDPKKKCKEQTYTSKSGIKGYEYIVKFDDLTDLEYIEYLIKQKYNSI